MLLKEGCCTRRTTKNQSGFTLVEVLLATVLLTLMAGGFTALHFSGLDSLDSQRDRVLLDSRLSSKMEELLSTEFSSLVSGSEAITVEGENHTLNWNVTPVDLDGDVNPDPGAVQVTVSIAGINDLSLTNIVVDTSGSVGKI
jgi:prepilin-type N-terminal cleavage/methylation domain-containing protein